MLTTLGRDAPGEICELAADWYCPGSCECIYADCMGFDRMPVTTSRGVRGFIPYVHAVSLQTLVGVFPRTWSIKVTHAKIPSTWKESIFWLEIRTSLSRAVVNGMPITRARVKTMIQDTRLGFPANWLHVATHRAGKLG